MSGLPLRAIAALALLATAAQGIEDIPPDFVPEEARVHATDCFNPPWNAWIPYLWTGLVVLVSLLICWTIAVTVRDWKKPSGMRRFTRWRGHDPAAAGSHDRSDAPSA